MTLSCLKRVFAQLLILTVFFILLEISFFIQSNQAYFFDFSFVSEHLHLPLRILPDIFYFLFAQLLIHFCYFLIIFSISILIGTLFNCSNDCFDRLAMSLWTFGLVMILIMNQYYYPNSKFAEFMRCFIWGPQFLHHALHLCFLLAAFLGLFALLGLLKILIYRAFYSVIGCFFLIIVVLLCGEKLKLLLLQQFNAVDRIVDGGTQETPNVILIGIDSLRPDFLSYFSASIDTPTIDAFLKTGTVFNHAMTPLARTFPAWTAILTGQYPIHSGVRYNLAPQTKLHLEDTLPQQLRKHGYLTMYATDETRFSNIDKNFGFDQIITPPMGLNDFLLGTFNDFPFSNLLLNTVIGRWLFPYSYANRAVYFSYRPEHFLSLVETNLPKVRTKPFFLAIHFCLPHYPYAWAQERMDTVSPLQRYIASIVAIDWQLKQFLFFLKQYAFLKHAIVVLLSDHGEALELTGDRLTRRDLFLAGSGHSKKIVPHFYPPSLDQERIDQSAGHGTDVLSFSQYRIVLAFKRYPEDLRYDHEFEERVSLLDIKPTILSLLHLKIPSSDGVSLAGYLNVKRSFLRESDTHSAHSLSYHLKHPPLFIESDYTPNAIRTIYPEENKVVLEGIQLFEIDPHNARLIVKPSMGKMIIHSKQYAIIDGEWVLALYPQRKGYYMPILFNLTTAQWTNDLTIPFASQSPALHLFSLLKKFYGHEIGQLTTRCALKKV